MPDGAEPVRAPGGPVPVEHAPPPRRRRRGWMIAVALVVVVGAALAVRALSTRKEAPAAAGPGGAAARAVPVVVAPAQRRDVPIYLQGLGSVVAYKTVAVRTQVDGRLQDVLFREGDAVKRGQVLAQIDPRPFDIQLHQAEGALARDAAQLAAARRNLERYRDLAAQKLIPQQQYDDQLATVGQLEGAVQIDKAAIESARLNLDYARITSPIDGVTGIRTVDPGNLVHASDANGIVLVTQLDPIAVLFTLPQDQLTAVATELARGALAVDVLSRDGAAPLGSGELLLIDNQINQATSTLRLKATVPNPKRLLWPNQFVNARLRLTTRRGAITVPGAALQRGPSGTFVYVVGADSAAAVRPVDVDITQGDVAVLAKGVQEGERVVVDGQNQLRPGAKVAVREAGRPGPTPPAASGEKGPAPAAGPSR